MSLEKHVVRGEYTHRASIHHPVFWCLGVRAMDAVVVLAGSLSTIAILAMMMLWVGCWVLADTAVPAGAAPAGRGRVLHVARAA